MSKHIIERPHNLLHTRTDIPIQPRPSKVSEVPRISGSNKQLLEKLWLLEEIAGFHQDERFILRGADAHLRLTFAHLRHMPHSSITPKPPMLAIEFRVPRRL